MKTFPELVDLARKGSENVDFSDSTGIQDVEFYQFLTDAHRRLESVIHGKHQRALTKIKVQSVAAFSETVDIPIDCYMNNRIILLEVGQTSSPDTFYTLKKGSIQERYSGISGHPVYYIRLGGQIILKPKLSIASNIRWTYQLALPSADKKRGKIESLTVDTTTRTITALKLDPTATDGVLDVDNLNQQQYITVVGRDGTVKLKKLEITSVDDDGTVNIYNGSHVYDDDESLAVGDFVCSGWYSSFRSQLPDICERYLLAYAVMKAHKRDSNIDISESIQELQAMEEDIAMSFAEPDSDVDYVPILDSQFIGVEHERGFY